MQVKHLYLDMPLSLIQIFDGINIVLHILLEVKIDIQNACYIFQLGAGNPEI